MQVVFKDNYECVINDNTTLHLGDMLCELLNYDKDSISQLHDELFLLMKSIDLVNDKKHEWTVAYFNALIKKMLISLQPYRERMMELPFYLYNKNIIEKAFEPFDNFIAYVQHQLAQNPEDTLLHDADIIFSPAQYEEAITYVMNILNEVSATQKCYFQIVDACLLYDLEPIGLKPINKLKLYGFDKFKKQIEPLFDTIYTATYSPQPLKYDIIGDDENLSLISYFDIRDLPEYIYQEFMKMIGANLYVRHCKNCGKYFVFYGERILEYCNNIAPGETKPCSVVGPVKIYNQKIKNDPILEIYTRAYKKYVARRRSNTISQEEFKEWSIKARGLRDRAYAENTPPEVFVEWMK